MKSPLKKKKMDLKEETGRIVRSTMSASANKIVELIKSSTTQVKK